MTNLVSIIRSSSQLIYNMNPYLIKISEIALKNKYLKYYISIIEKALLRPQNRKILKEQLGYVESHHILPESFGLGGEKDRLNLVFLTAKEHFIVHLCAAKMFTSIFKNKMIFAFRLLKSKNPHQAARVTSRMYAILKPDFKSFVRLYKDRVVRYLYDTQIEEIAQLELDGWSRKMTAEYKKYCTGTTPKGTIRSQETRDRLSKSLKGKPRPHTRGRKMSEETKRRAKETRRRIKEDEPARYRASSERRSAALKKSYMAGNRDGIVNGMTGKTHGEEVRLQMSKKKKELWQKILSDPDKHAEYVKRATIVNRKTWESQELRDKCKIIRSKAYLQYGVHPQEFYKQKLRPLLQLGFLPTAIVRYRLLDMHAGSIKLWIKRYGSEEDMTQFEENKKKGAGANKAYIKFQEDQYKKHFFCGPPRPNDL